MLIDTIGLGIIIPVLPRLIVDLTGTDLGNAAVYGGWLMVCYAAMQFLFAPVLGNLSDRFGRRPVLLISLAAFGIDYALMGFAPTIAWLFVGRLIAGIAGSTAATANAFIADVTPPEKRAQNFGLIGAAWGLGFIIGPVIGGFLGEYGARIPFFAAAALAGLNLLYGLVVLPETLTPEKRRPFSWRRANTLGAMKQMTTFPIVFALFGALVLYQIAHDANPAVWTFYTKLKFSWTERDIGFSMGMVGLMVTIVMGGLTRVIIPRLGETKSAYLGLAAGTIGFIGFALATKGWMMFAFIVPFSLIGLTMPALRGIMSRQIPENAQGELQGALTSIASLTAIVAPLFMTQLFRAFSEPGAAFLFPGAPFLAAGLFLLAALAIAGRALGRAVAARRI